jgi:predicted SnoaL-like aldol condensation-catalyzing enzyme
MSLILTAALAAAAAAGQPVQQACPAVSEQTIRRDFNRFVDLLLVDRKPREAFETYAVPDLIQHSKAFGTNRESTIAQWNTMITPTSQFSIKGVSIEGGIGLVRFRGKLGPGPGANVTDYYRFECGKIAETWDSFEVGD